MEKLIIRGVLIFSILLTIVFSYGYNSQLMGINVYALSDEINYLIVWQIGMWLFSTLTLTLAVVVTGLWLREQEQRKYFRTSPYPLYAKNQRTYHVRANRSDHENHPIAR